MKPRPWKHWLGRLDYWKSIRLDIGESFFKYNGVVCSGRLFTPSLNVFKYPSRYSPGKRGLILQLTLPEWEVVWETSLFPYNMNYCLIQWHLLIPWPFKKRQYQLQTISANLRMPTETGRKKYVLTLPLLWAVLAADKTGTNTMVTTGLKQVCVCLAWVADKGYFILLPSSMS